MYVLFRCEDPNVFEVDTYDLEIDADSVDEACAKLCEHIRTQLDPRAWDRNEFADCVTVDEKVELFRNWVTILDILENGKYTCEIYRPGLDDDAYLVTLPLLKMLNA